MRKTVSLQNTTLKLLLITVGLVIGYGRANAQFTNLPVSGFTSDQVADGVGPATGSTTAALDGGVDGGGFVFIDGTYQYSSACPAFTTNVLPANNQIASGVASGLTYQLQPYNQSNALRIPATGANGTGTGTLTLASPTNMARLYLLVVAGSGPITNGITVTVTFADATTETLATNVTAQNWCTGSTSGATTVIPQVYNRIAATTTTCAAATCQYLFEMSLPLSVSNYNKQVVSINISKSVTTGIFNVFAAGTQPPCVAPSAQPSALTQGAPATNQIAGGFTAASGSPYGYLVVRYPTGATATAPVDGTTYTAGQALGAGTVVQSASATSFTSTGLPAGTAYDFYVYAYNGAICGGGPLYNTAAPLTGTLSTAACGNGLAAGTYSVGPSGATYQTLTAAIAAINNLGVNGPVTLELQAGYTSGGETFPLTLASNACTNATSLVTIRPEAGASNLTITSSNATSTIDINSGTLFTIDGRPGGAGTTQALTIQNTNTAGVAVRFINEAIKNRITYCNIQGVNTSATGGVIQFATTTGANGNDSNAITFCNISGTSSTNTPTTLIYSSGSTGTTAQYNNNDTVANCNLYDFFNATAESNGFKLGNGNGGNANWAILNNSFYQTTARTVTGTSTQYPLNLNCPNGSGYVVTGNYIGGSAPLCGGSAWTVLGSGNSRFVGIYIRLLGTGTQSVFTANTLANYSWTTTSATANTSAPGTWGGIQFFEGNAAVTGNTIGSTAGPSIAVTTSANGSVYGIFGNSSQVNTYAITGNTVAGITANTTGAATTYAGIFGISIGSGSATTTTVYNVSGNTIGGSLANSLFASKASTSTQIVRGIEVTAGGARANITGNTIQNLTNSAVATGTTIAQTVGVYTATGVDSIAGNTVTALLNSAQQTNINASASVIGISQISPVAGASVNKNTVYDLRNTATTGAVGVVGINHTAATSGTNAVAGNLVHSLSAASATATSSLIGLSITGGASNVQNNMVSMGTNAAGAPITTGYAVYGIYETGGTNNYYHNSVYVGGAGVASATSTYGFYSTVSSGTRSILNNIFHNARSNASGSAANYGVRIGAATGLTSNGNVVFFDNTSGGSFGAVGTTPYATLQTWQSATGQDGLSAFANPQFIAPAAGGTATNLHINPSVATPVEGAGVPAPVTEDFDGEARSGLTPVDIGSDAGIFTPLDVQPPVITYTLLSGIYSTGNQTVSATITDATGLPTTGSLVPRIYFKKFAAGTYASSAGAFSSGTAQNGAWNFTIDAALLGGLQAGDSVYYYVIAQDLAGNIGSNPAGAVATDVNTVSTHPPAPAAYRVLAVLSGTIPVGAGQAITTLTDNGGLFQQIAINGLSGDVTAVISSDLTESGTHALPAYATQGGAAYKVNIVPDGTTERLISGAAASPGLIRFSGARHAKIDGSFGGSGRYLRLRNSNSGGSTVTFINDARRDTVMNCFVEGNNTSTGNILFGVGVSTGNDSNVVSGNFIRDLTNTVGLTNTGVSSANATAPADNSENTIAGNEFVNCVFNGINLNNGATGNNWQITGNSFYQTASRTNAMGIILVTSGGGHVISNNSIGGAAADRSLAATTTTGNVNAIELNGTVVPATPITVSGNLISNISTSAAFTAITATTVPVVVSGNSVGGLQPYDTLRVGAASSYIVTGGAATISGNTIRNGSYYGTGSVRTAGILVSSGTATVSGNTIDNLKSSSTGALSTNNVIGIAVTGGTGHTVSSNTVSNIYNTNAGTTAYFVSGISVTGNTGSTWVRNRVYNIYAAGTGAGTSAPQVFGMHMSSSSTENVLNNQIAVGANTVDQTRAYGIQDISGSGTHNYFNNAVYISGATTATGNAYAFQRTGNGTMVLRNNILYNGRNGGTGFNYALGISSTTGFTAANSNYNLLVVPSASQLVELPSGTSLDIAGYNATFTALPNANWTTESATLAASQLFTDPSTGNLNTNASNPEAWYVNGKGLPLAAVTTDYTGAPRSTAVAAGATDIGSTEFSTSATPPSATESAPPAPGTTNFYTFGGRRIAIFNWDAAGTPPASLNVKLYTGSDAPAVPGTAPRFNAYYDIIANGGTGYGYTVSLAYDSSMLGSVPSSADARLAKYDGTTWTDYPTSSANPVTGYLNSNVTLNSFSIFTGASAAFPLPLSGMEISAAAEGAANRINWTALHTTSGDHFLVERSADGQEFSALAEMPATGAVRYSHLDAQPLTGTSYYRVRLTRADGTVSFSKTVSLRRSATTSGPVVSLSPNPVTDVLRVKVQGALAPDAALILTDVTGRVALTQNITAAETAVDMSRLPAGAYILRIRADGWSESVKVVKQ